MAKLSEEVLEEGRQFIRQKDLDGLLAWKNAHAKSCVSEDVFTDTYRTIFRAGDTQKGLFIFNKVFPDWDPVVEVTHALSRLAWLVLGVLGAIGGLIYLLKAVLHH